MASLPYPYSPDPSIAKTITPLWAMRGGWVTDLSAINYQTCWDKFGVRVLYVQRTDHNVAELHSYGDKLRGMGFKIAGWSALNEGDDPIQLAKSDAAMVAECNLDGWVTDHEFETEAHPCYAETWIINFRALLPTLPLMLSCMPGPRPATLSHLAWLTAGADISPQCYQGEIGDAGEVSWSANYWLGVQRLPRVRLRVSLGVDKNAHPWSMEQYLADMRQWGLGGYSLWHLEAIAPAGA